MKNRSEIEKALRRESWRSLYDLASTKPAGGAETNLPDRGRPNMLWPDRPGTVAGLSGNARIVAYDIVTYLDSQF